MVYTHTLSINLLYSLYIIQISTQEEDDDDDDNCFCKQSRMRTMNDSNKWFSLICHGKIIKLIIIHIGTWTFFCLSDGWAHFVPVLLYRIDYEISMYISNMFIVCCATHWAAASNKIDIMLISRLYRNNNIPQLLLLRSSSWVIIVKVWRPNR